MRKPTCLMLCGSFTHGQLFLICNSTSEFNIFFSISCKPSHLLTFSFITSPTTFCTEPPYCPISKFSSHNYLVFNLLFCYHCLLSAGNDNLTPPPTTNKAPSIFRTLQKLSCKANKLLPGSVFSIRGCSLPGA